MKSIGNSIGSLVIIVIIGLVLLPLTLLAIICACEFVRRRTKAKRLAARTSLIANNH